MEAFRGSKSWAAEHLEISKINLIRLIEYLQFLQTLKER